MNVDDRAIGGTADRATVLTHRIPTAYARAWGAATDIAVFWLLMAGLAWVPFWNGSNELIAWGINAVLFASIVFAYEFSLLIRGASHPVGVRNIAVPAALFLSVLLWVYVQTAAWSHSGLSHPIWAMAADALGRPVEGSISVNRDLTNLALLRLVTAALVFWLSFQLCRDAKRARSLLIGIGVIGASYAIYGLIAVSAPVTRLAWLDNVSVDGLISSTFINRNSFAAYA